MMPTFPRSPLSFRTAGFPRYGCKADISYSDGAFPSHRQLKTAPSIHWQMFGLHPPFVHFVATSLIPHCVGPSARSRTVVEVGSSSAPGVLALTRVMLSRAVLT
jgi:hypothetical protein